MELIFLNIFLVGAGLLLWLIIRALPRLDESAVDRKNIFDRWLTSALPERIDAYARAAFLRVLRRLKVWMLRIDNGINRKLQIMKLESDAPLRVPTKIDLKKVGRRRAAHGKLPQAGEAAAEEREEKLK